MERIVWDEKYNIGVEVVDKAHAKLFRIIDKLLENLQDVTSNQHTYMEGIKYLDAYAMKHFSEEEAFMRSIHYSRYAQHKKIHDNFRDKTLLSLKKDLELSGYSSVAVKRFVETMSLWLSEHILKADQAIVGRKAVSKKRDLSSQIAAISRTIDRATTEVFQTEMKLINEKYKGLNIGDAYYCRQCFDVEGGIKLQILLGIEEPLILRGANRIVRRKTVQKSDITTAMLLKIFEQMFERIGRLFRAEEESALKKENLLTVEEFRTEFMKGYPCSLLYSNKVGHLAFCYRNWRVRT